MSIKARAGEEEEGIWKHNQDCSFSRRRRDMPPPFRANRDNSRFSSDVHFNLSASYLKRADQSVSGQFHQHLNTTPPPLPPPSPFLSRPHSAFPSAISSSALGQRNNPPALWISLHTGLRKERRNEEKTGRDGANGRGNGEKEREREERGGWASFEKCWVK